MKFSEVKGKYKCDNNSTHIFEANNVKLIPFSKNFNIFGKLVYLISKDKTLKYVPTNQAEESDQVLCCPVCGYAHLFGFDIVK